MIKFSSIKSDKCDMVHESLSLIIPNTTPNTSQSIGESRVSMASGTTSSCSESIKTTSFRSNISNLSRTPSSLSHQTSSNDVVIVHHLNSSSQCMATLSSPNNQMISCLAAHGSLLYVASGGVINVYDHSTFSLIDTFNGGCGNRLPSSGLVKSIAFDGGKVFSAHQDHRIRVWKVERSKRHRLVKTLPTLKDRLCRFVFPENYVVVRRHKRRLWIEHNDAVSGLSANNGLLYSVSWDRTLKVWRASESKCMESVLGAHDDAINAVEASTAGDGAVYTASADGTIKVWQIVQRSGTCGSLALVADLRRGNACAVNALALASDGMSLLSGSCEGEVAVWGRENGERLDRMRARAAVMGHDGAVLCIVAVDRGVFATGSADRTVRIWGEYGEGLCCLGVLDGHRKAVRSLTAVEDEDRNGVVSVVSGSLDGEVKIWRVTVSNAEYDVSCASY